MYNVFNIFLFYSIFGNIFERVIMNFNNKSYVSGFMGTIFTPIYGIAVLVILNIHKRIKIKNKFLKILVEFLIYVIVLTILEFIGGILIEKVFNKVYWNYEPFKYNIGKYVSLESSLLWGVLSISVLYLIHPIYKKLEPHIPKFITIGFSLFFIINLIFSLFVKLA